MKRFPLILFHFLLLYRDYTINKVDLNVIKRFLTSLHGILNIHITVTGKEKINHNTQKIYVSNHVCYCDILPLPIYLHGGIVSSKGGMNNPIAPILAAGVNVLVIDRGLCCNDDVVT